MVPSWFTIDDDEGFFLILPFFIGFVVMTIYAAALATDALLKIHDNGHAEKCTCWIN